MAVPTKGAVRIQVAAAPEHVYDLVSDMTRMGQWSPECYRVEWVEGASGPVVGAQFMGHNRMGPYRWAVGGKVVEAERGRSFAFTTYTGERESTRWRYRFEPSATGTEVTEDYQYLWSSRWIRVVNTFMPRRTVLLRGIRSTLERIKAAAESST